VLLLDGISPGGQVKLDAKKDYFRLNARRTAIDQITNAVRQHNMYLGGGEA